MKKYMKPALKAVEFECKDKISINVVSGVEGNGKAEIKRYEEDNFLEFQEIEDNLNPWKRNK